MSKQLPRALGHGLWQFVKELLCLFKLRYIYATSFYYISLIGSTFSTFHADVCQIFDCLQFPVAQPLHFLGSSVPIFYREHKTNA